MPSTAAAGPESPQTQFQKQNERFAYWFWQFFDKSLVSGLPRRPARSRPRTTPGPYHVGSGPYHGGSGTGGPGRPSGRRPARSRPRTTPEPYHGGSGPYRKGSDTGRVRKEPKKHGIRSTGGPRSKQKHVLWEFAGFGGTRKDCTLGTRDPRPAVKTHASRIPGGRLWPIPL